jgi:hypothetical protein
VQLRGTGTPIRLVALFHFDFTSARSAVARFPALAGA